MTPKTIATLLILSAFATAGANSASGDDRAFKGGSVHGRGNHGKRPLITGGFVGLDGFGNGGGYGNGYGDWYGISSGHDECPLFRKRVPTPDGWRVQMVPVC
jgi:hypothetical protein